MQEIRRNEEDPFASWGEKLRAAKELPGYPKADKAALWKRLEVMLEEDKKAEKEKRRTRRVTMFWYSAAASIILLLAVMIFSKAPEKHDLIGEKKLKPATEKPVPIIIERNDQLAKEDVKPSGVENDPATETTQVVRPPRLVAMETTPDKIDNNSPVNDQEPQVQDPQPNENLASNENPGRIEQPIAADPQKMPIFHSGSMKKHPVTPASVAIYIEKVVNKDDQKVAAKTNPDNPEHILTFK